MMHQGHALDVLRGLPSASVHCCVTSPPYYGLRSYRTAPQIWGDGWSGEFGSESTPEMYIEHLVSVFREVRRVLDDKGVLWLNLGDSYASTGGPQNGVGTGIKTKDLIGIPWMAAFAMRTDGWYLRSDIIWHKPNAMPESVKDRCTRAHEYIFMFSKSERYYYDLDSVVEPAIGAKRIRKDRFGGTKYNQDDTKHSEGSIFVTALTRNLRSVWVINTKPFADSHFAVFPDDLVTPMILAGTPRSGIVLDPFAGSGTVGVVCVRTNRQFLGIELNPDYVKMAERRIMNEILTQALVV